MQFNELQLNVEAGKLGLSSGFTVILFGFNPQPLLHIKIQLHICDPILCVPAGKSSFHLCRYYKQPTGLVQNIQSEQTEHKS